MSDSIIVSDPKRFRRWEVIAFGPVALIVTGVSNSGIRVRPLRWYDAIVVWFVRGPERLRDWWRGVA